MCQSPGTLMNPKIVCGSDFSPGQSHDDPKISVGNLTMAHTRPGKHTKNYGRSTMFNG